MAVNPLLRSNPIRMMGMASGMDTDSIIQATLRMHQFKIDNQMRSRQLLEWKQTMHNDIKDQIKGFQDTYLRTLSSKTMMLRSTFNTNLATATAGGKASTAVTVSASSSSSLGNLKITQVKSLAKGTSITSRGAVSSGGVGLDMSARLSDLNFKNAGGIDFGLGSSSDKVDVNSSSGVTSITRGQIEGAAWSATGEAKYKIGDDDVSFTRNNSTGAVSYSLNDGTAVELTFTGDPGEPAVASFTLENGDRVEVTKDVNGVLSFQKYKTEEDEDGISQEVADGSNVQMMFKSTSSVTGANGGTVELVRYTNGNDAQDVVQAGGRTINDSVYYGEASITIDVNGTSKSVTLNSNMTVNEMVNAINKEISGATLSYDRMGDVFRLEHNTIGNSGTISVSGSAGVIESLFGGSATTVNAGAVTGTQAEVVFSDGTSAKSDTNNISYRGITIKVNHETGILTGDDIINVSVTRDTDKAVAAIKDYVDSYNTLIKKLEDLLNERKTGKEVGYKPLTDEEKQSMTEKQVEEWEAIAKKGLLRSDKTIQDLVSKLRSTMFESIEGVGMSPSQIGITTGNYFGGTGGQIVLNEDKLRAALEENPDRVADIFCRIDGSSGESKGVGLMHKVNDILTNYTRLEGAQDITLTNLEKSLKEINDRIAKMEERMWAEEDKLYRQFAAMETALSQVQNQGAWFQAMLGNG